MVASSPLIHPICVDAQTPSKLRIPGHKTLVSLDQILWLQGDWNYCRLHLVSGRQLVISYTLKFMHQQLPQLTRIHKVALVNLSHVQMFELLEGFSNKRGKVRLTEGTELPVARRRIKEIRHALRARAAQ